MSTTRTARAGWPPHSLLLLVMLGLSAMAPVAPGGKRFDGLTTCAACVDAGFGWSLKKSKCGMFANRDCGGSTAADSSEPRHRRPRAGAHRPRHRGRTWASCRSSAPCRA